MDKYIEVEKQTTIKGCLDELDSLKGYFSLLIPIYNAKVTGKGRLYQAPELYANFLFFDTQVPSFKQYKENDYWKELKGYLGLKVNHLK